MAGWAVQCAPSTPSAISRYVGHASIVVTSSRNAAWAAAGSGRTVTDCRKSIPGFPQPRTSKKAGGAGTTVTASTQEAGSTTVPAGRPQGTCPEVTTASTPGLAAGTSATRSAAVTNRPRLVVA